MLLHPEQPARVLKLSPNPILVPEADFEREGFVPNVIFPTGAVVRGDTLLIYYGAADTCTGVAELALREVLRF
jgi:beta-1,2-mannobiose phosphorylase / 1,2-beta-oligomannan phosphorylase